MPEQPSSFETLSYESSSGCGLRVRFSLILRANEVSVLKDEGKAGGTAPVWVARTPACAGAGKPGHDTV